MNSQLNSFNAIASAYNILAKIVFGNTMAQSQTVHLNEIGNAKNVLVLGGGTGEWLGTFQKEHPNSMIWYIEASSKMISLAEKNVHDEKRIIFIHGTHLDLPKEATYSTVILFFFLDMFDAKGIRNLVELLRVKCNPDCKWLISDFVRANIWQEGMLKIMYYFFSLTTNLKMSSLPNWKAELKSGGLGTISKRFFYGGFICSSVYKLM